jgi:hypothetical protein
LPLPIVPEFRFEINQYALTVAYLKKNLVVGRFLNSDQNLAETFSYKFVDNAGSGADNKYFSIQDNLLLSNTEGVDLWSFGGLHVEALSSTGDSWASKAGVKFGNIQKGRFDKVTFEYFPNASNLQYLDANTLIGKFELARESSS